MHRGPFDLQPQLQRAGAWSSRSLGAPPLWFVYLLGWQSAVPILLTAWPLLWPTPPAYAERGCALHTRHSSSDASVRAWAMTWDNALSLSCQKLFHIPVDAASFSGWTLCTLFLLCCLSLSFFPFSLPSLTTTIRTNEEREKTLPLTLVRPHPHPLSCVSVVPPTSKHRQ